MNGSRYRPWRVFAIGAAVLALMALGASIALGVNRGTVGELNYQRSERLIANTTAVGLFEGTVYCPPGRHVTGGGVGDLTSIDIHVSSPIDGEDEDTIPDDGWRAYVTNDSGSRQRWFVYAICDA